LIHRNTLKSILTTSDRWNSNRSDLNQTNFATIGKFMKYIILAMASVFSINAFSAIGDPYSIKCSSGKTVIFTAQISEGADPGYENVRVYVYGLGNEKFNSTIVKGVLNKLKTSQATSLAFTHPETKQSARIILNETTTTDGEVLRGMGQVDYQNYTRENLNCSVVLRTN
jgi:hypothetical protein